MANILAGKEVVPEFIQFNADPKKIAGFITEFLDEKKYKSKVEELLSFRKLLGEPGGSRRAAEIILEKL
jgi:lipid-A-disaccharide synthase